MSLLAVPSEPSVVADPQGDAAYYRGVLHELIDLGTALARAMVERATAAEPIANPADASEAFERVARAVRRTVRLAEYLASPRPVRVERSAEQQAVTNRRRVLRGVEDAIQDEVCGDAAARMRAEVLERLECPDLDDELRDRTVDQVIQMVRRDLGITEMAGITRWMRRTPEDVAALEARAAVTPRSGPEALDGLDAGGPNRAVRRMLRSVPKARGP